MKRRILAMILGISAMLMLLESVFPGYTYNFLVSINQFVNTVFAGDPDQTISIRNGLAKAQGHWFASDIVCPFLDIFETDHCEKAADLPPYDNDGI